MALDFILLIFYFTTYFIFLASKLFSKHFYDFLELKTTTFSEELYSEFFLIDYFYDEQNILNDFLGLSANYS